MRIMAPIACVLAAGSLLIGAAAQAATVIANFGDHPDASLFKAGGDPYGVRIDSEDPPAGAGPTFSVGTNLGGGGGLVQLTWDDTLGPAAEATISGVVQRSDDDTFWNVTYDMVGLIAADNDGFKVTGSASGSLNEIGGSRVINIDGIPLPDGTIFQFDNDGYRLDNDTTTWVGRGWLLDNGQTDDWLVTGTIVPIPAAAWLFASALGLLGWVRRRMN